MDTANHFLNNLAGAANHAITRHGGVFNSSAGDYQLRCLGLGVKTADQQFQNVLDDTAADFVSASGNLQHRLMSLKGSMLPEVHEQLLTITSGMVARVQQILVDWETQSRKLRKFAMLQNEILYKAGNDTEWEDEFIQSLAKLDMGHGNIDALIAKLEKTSNDLDIAKANANVAAAEAELNRLIAVRAQADAAESKQRRDVSTNVANAAKAANGKVASAQPKHQHRSSRTTKPTK